MSGTALLLGNSDGIGLSTTEALLERGWTVIGVSRSESPVNHDAYRHHVCDVRDQGYEVLLRTLVDEQPALDLCVYCVGIGELLDPTDMEQEAEIIDVNLGAMVRTAARVVPAMVARGTGHLIGLSSLADVLLSPEAPSYHASKAGFSSYLESLALALRPKGVAVTNLRFGFVDTKMAKGDVKPFMMSVDQAAAHLLRCVEQRPMRYTAPRKALPLVWFRDFMLRRGLA